MPRSHRLDIANGLHHVTQRGLERRNIVLNEDDRSHWWRLFERVARRCQWRVFAVALLDNHFYISQQILLGLILESLIGDILPAR